MPKKRRDEGRVSVTELTVIHPGWNDRYVHIDGDGDIFIADAQHGNVGACRVLVSKQMVPAMIRALKIAIGG